MATAREIEVLNTVNRVNRAQQIEDERLLATKKEAENARAEKQALHKHIGAADQKTDDLDSQIQLKEEHLAGLNATIVTMEQKKVEVEVEVEAEASAAIVAPAYIIHTHIHYFRNGPPPQAQPAAQKARRARQSSSKPNKRLDKEPKFSNVCKRGDECPNRTCGFVHPKHIQLFRHKIGTLDEAPK